jgi:ATP-dependent Clp protease ATP-binding subunit ClpC
MFERYTEKARRVIFLSRYEASQFGASQIETEHILLGLIREDGKLAARFSIERNANLELIREEIEARTKVRARISTQIDLPLSGASKRALAFAAEESDLLGHHHIGTEHLLLGLMREENSIAAEILHDRGLRFSDIRQDLSRQANLQQSGAATSSKGEVTMSYQIAQTPSRDASQPADIDDRWSPELLAAGIEAGLFTQEEFVGERERVASLRQFKVDTEALLRMLTAKGLVDPQRLTTLAFELRDENKLAEFIENLRQQ